MLNNINSLEEKTNNNIIKYSDIVKSNLPSSSCTATHPNPTPPYSKPSIINDFYYLPIET